MKQWEHSVQRYGGTGSLVEMLNEAGAKGWEVCGGFEGRRALYIFFKRPIEPVPVALQGVEIERQS